MDTLASRLAHAMAERGRKITPLAEAAGMTYQGVKKILDGKTATIKADSLFPMAHYLKVDPTWLSTGEGTMSAGGGLVVGGPQAALTTAAPTLTQALEVLAAHMDNLSEADREAAAQSLQTLARAPDSAKAKAGALASLGAARTSQHNTAMGAGETPHFLKK